MTTRADVSGARAIAPRTLDPPKYPGAPAAKQPASSASSPSYQQPSATQINQAAKAIEVTLQSISAANQPIPVLYGYPLYVGARLAGVVSDGFHALHLIGVLGYGELTRIDAAYVDDAPLANVPAGTPPADAMATMRYLGTPDQAVDERLAIAYAARGVTFTDTMPGIGYVRVTLLSTMNLQQLPNIAVLCGGKRVLDMRTGALAATDDLAANPVLCLADFISDPRYGLGGAYDVASFSTAADFCDELTGDGPRYRIALALTAAQTVDAWLAQLVAYTGCILWRRAGVYYLTPMVARATTITIGKADIIADSFELALRAQRELPTHVTVSYTDWSAMPPSTRAATQPDGAVDDGRESTVQLPGVTRRNMAARIAGRRLNAIWAGQLTAAWRAFDAALTYRQGDVLALTFPEYGLSGAHFAITALEDQGFGRWKVSAETYDADAFVDTPLPPAPILDPGEMVPPTAATAPVFVGPVTQSEELVEFANGDWRPRLRATWPEVADPTTLAYYAVTLTDLTDGVVVQSSNVPTGEFISTAVAEEHQYTTTVVAVGPSGLTSPPVTSAPLLVLGKLAPPANVQNFVVIEAGGVLYCSWSPVPDPDRDEYEIRRGAPGAAWDTMVVVSRLHATNTVLNSQPQGLLDYAIKAKDTTGHYSTLEARQPVSVTQDQNLQISGPNRFTSWTTSNVALWAEAGNTVMVNTDPAGLWADGATDPNNATGTFNDVLRDVVVASPNAVAAWMQSAPFDFGVVVGNTRVSCTAPYTVLLAGSSGGVTVLVEASTDGTTYTPIGPTEMRSVRYVRCRLNIAAGTVIRSLQNWTVSLVAVLVTEQGNVSVGATGKATVTLAERYSAWVSVMATPQGSVPNVMATFDNVVVGMGIPNTVDIWCFKNNQPAAGTVSWVFRGTR